MDIDFRSLTNLAFALAFGVMGCAPGSEAGSPHLTATAGGRWYEIDASSGDAPETEPAEAGVGEGGPEIEGPLPAAWGYRGDGAGVHWGGFWKTEGQDIVDQHGRKVVLKGLGLAGYFFPERYLLGLEGGTVAYGGPHGIRKRILELAGQEAADAFWSAWFENWLTEKDIAAVAQLGFNHVRIPFVAYETVDRSGNVLSPAIDRLDRAIAWCSKYKLKVILDMHSAPGGQNPTPIAPEYSDGLFGNAANERWTTAAWVALARRYANDQAVLGYDLLNEPVLRGSQSSTDETLRTFYEKLVEDIRREDRNHILFLEGNSWDTPPSTFMPIRDMANVAWSYHAYWTGTAPDPQVLAIRERCNCPLWNGEFGENSNEWIAVTASRMLDANIGYTLWGLKKLDVTTQPFSTHSEVPFGWQAVRLALRGEGPPPPSREMQEGLVNMAKGMHFDRLDFLSDVVQAVLHPNRYLSGSYPYRAHAVPGTIFAGDYDDGIQDKAYHEVNSGLLSLEGHPEDIGHTTGYGHWVFWNYRPIYRNGGPDFKWDEAERSPYVFGWTGGHEDYEWMNYTVSAPEGRYVVEVRARGPERSRMRVGNEPFVDVSGSQWTWKTLASSYPLAENSQLRVTFDGRDIGLHSLRISASSSSAP